MATVPAFVIEELTGRQRSVALRGRALPERGVSFGVAMRVKAFWYAGNPEATLQILGPEILGTKIKGRWSDRFLEGQVEVSGFDEVHTAEQLVAIFEQLTLGAQQLRVQWGPKTRVGVLETFTPEYPREQDIDWEAEFTWSGREGGAPRAAPDPEPPPNMLSAMNAIDDELAFEPPGTLPDFRAQALAGIDSLRSRAGVIFDRLRLVSNLAALPADALGAIAAAVESVRVEAEDELQRLADVPYTAARTVDRVADVLSFSSWRLNVASDVRKFRATSFRVERDARTAVVPGSLAVVIVPADTSLRALALKYYGTSDAWQDIANVNSLVGSIVPAGTVLIVPARATSAATEMVLR